MTIDKEILERIKSIKWFINCGKNITENINFEKKYIKNWKNAIEMIKGDNWNNITLEANNILAEFLDNKFHSDFQNWNKIVRDGKLFLKENIEQELSKSCKENKINNDFLRSVLWDLLGAIMEDTYKKCKKRPVFFLHLLEIYESGNLPCGWEGKWPDGKLIVF